MKHSVESITSDTPARQELVGFLANFENENRGEVFWQKRLAFWWDENPFSLRELLKGWVLRADEKIVGFLGLIPSEYVYREKIYRAFAATTWRVEKEHRNASLPMFMKWHALGREFILLDTTANEEVAKILDHFKYCAEKTMHSHLFPIRGMSGFKGLTLIPLHWFARLSLPRLRLKVVTLQDGFRIAQSNERSDRLKKRISREYLNWFCRSPVAQKQFVGCVNENRELSSYLIFEPDKYGRHDVLSMIDYFTMGENEDEVLGLVRHVISSPQFTRNRFQFFMLNVLGENWPLQGTIQRMNPAKHYYSLPKSLAGVPKRCLLAEGDYGC